MAKTEIGRAVGSEGERALETLIRFMGWPTPVREYPFMPGRKWRADFAWPAKSLLVEVEGGTWSNGRHVRGKGYEQDLERANAAVLAGYRVLRFTTDMVIDGRAVTALSGIFLP